MNSSRFKGKPLSWWRQTPLYLSRWSRAQLRQALHETAVGNVVWEYGGRPSPPPHRIKQRVLRQYAQRYGLRTLIETGTLRGDMIEALREDFERLVSIELAPALCEAARQRFADAPHVELVLGDSAQELPKLLPALTTPTLFWLDGHYSGGETALGSQSTPISEELASILARAADDPQGVGRSVILVDDARCFGHWHDYPSLSALRAAVIREAPSCQWEVRDDIIRIVLDG